MNEELAKVEGLTQDVINNTWLWMPNWKWVVLTLALVTSVTLYKILTWTLTRVRNRMKSRLTTDSVLGLLTTHEIQRPISAIITFLFLATVIKILSLPGDGAHVFSILLKLAIAFAVISLLYITAGALGERFTQISAKTENTLDDQLAPLLTRTLKFLVIVFGFLVTLQNVGVNVVSVLAGLGLGGLAVALAAQDTFANIFGSITLIFDRPFQIGDLVNVAGVEGTVTEIGLRSTRIRLATGSLVSVPNSVMAKEKIENLGARSTRRIRHTIGVTYETTPTKLVEFIEHIRYLINQHPMVDKENITVVLSGLGDSSINILMNFFVRSIDLNDEQRVQQEILIQIMQLAEQNEVEFAFPTRSVRIDTIPTGVAEALMPRRQPSAMPPTTSGV